MIQVKLMAVAFLSGNQFRKLFWNITAGLVGYWAVYRNIDRVYILPENLMALLSGHVMALLV